MNELNGYDLTDHSLYISDFIWNACFGLLLLLNSICLFLFSFFPLFLLMIVSLLVLLTFLCGSFELICCRKRYSFNNKSFCTIMNFTFNCKIRFFLFSYLSNETHGIYIYYVICIEISSVQFWNTSPEEKPAKPRINPDLQQFQMTPLSAWEH